MFGSQTYASSANLVPSPISCFTGPPTIFQLIRKQVVTLLLMASRFLAHFWRGAPVLLLHLIGPRSSMGLFLNYHNEVKVHLLIASTHSDLNGHYQNKSGNVLVQKNPVLSVKFVHHTTFWLVSNSILISCFHDRYYLSKL